MKFNSLTNPNQLLQEKMRFFVEYFSFTNEFLGKLPEIPFENCHSLLSKILYQIEYNQEKCVQYIENYFTQLFSFFSPSFVDKTSNYNTLRIQYEEMRTFKIEPKPNKEKSNKLIWIKQNPEFIENIRKLRDESVLDLENSVRFVYSVLTCTHALKIHIESIKYCTHIIVSDFRLNGHSKELVESFVKRILSKDSFPFPINILELSDSENKIGEQNQFLENRNFKDQLEGLKNFKFLFKFQKGYFIYIIKNCLLEKNVQPLFHVRIDNVTFTSTEHESISRVKEDVEKQSRGKRYSLYSEFFNENYILAFINLNYIDEETTMKEGLKYVKEELIQFNAYLNRNLIVDENDYIFSNDLSKGYKNAKIRLTKNALVQVSSLDFEQAKNNAFEILRNVESKAKSKILENEKTFVKALSNNDISTYWIYIENLFWNTKFANPIIQKEKIRKILIQHFDDFRHKILASVISALYFSEASVDDTGLTHEEMKVIYDGIHSNLDYSINYSTYKKRVKTAFLKDIFTYLHDFNSTAKKEKWKKFHNSALTELYEYRNNELHSGKVNTSSENKLASIIPSMINTLRWLLINSCVQYPELNFEELILKLSQLK